MKKISYLILLICSINYSCRKDKKDTNTDSHKNIYAIGYLVNAPTSYLPIPVYWQEGKEIILGDDSAATTSISIKGDDVYITGHIDFKPVFWKNGIAYYLPFSGTTGVSISISFDNNDIYIVGSDDGENVIWKNGIIFKKLPKLQDYKRIITYKGDVHYLVQKNKSGNSVTEYWKNETATEIKPYNKIIKHLALLNDDVYWAGTNQKETEVSIWKNNIQTIIASASDTNRIQLQLESICIDDADVYVFYYEVDIIARTFIVKYWKNGSLFSLKTPNNFDPGYFKAIGGKIYYTGVYENALFNGAFYFINETPHYLNKSYYSGVQDIAVKP
jgi:hypothetical protein